MTRTKFSRIVDADVGPDARIYDQVNLYKCRIGARTKIDAFVYVEEGVSIGADCKIRPHCFLPTGVSLGDRVFLGPHVVFTNDRHPRIAAGDDWRLEPTIVEDDVSIGAGAVVLPGVRIGKGSTIGAGSVVTKDVPPGSTAWGNPAKVMRRAPAPAKRRRT